jgi:uncharacterized protein YigE (DUF2233 family)
MRFAALAVFLAVAGCGGDEANSSGNEEKPKAEAPPSACRSETFEGAALTHCIADPAKHTISLVVRHKGGPPYRSLTALAADRGTKPPKVAFAMNAGMFDDSGQPIGYYAEDGKRLHKLNRAKGSGNFHLPPNGVFYGSDGQWELRTADDFARKVTKRPQFGTQSGPMLVIDGELHPKISDDGDSKYIRNAVGLDAEGRAHFVISDAPLSFGKLARYYRDELKVPNALYFDGNVSALWDPAMGRLDTGPPLGPLIVVEKRAKAKP